MGGIIDRIATNPNDPVPRRNKRPLSQVSMEQRREKLTIAEVQSGQRIKLSRGAQVVSRSVEPAPTRSASQVGYVNPRGRSSLSRERDYEAELSLAAIQEGL